MSNMKITMLGKYQNLFFQYQLKIYAKYFKCTLLNSQLLLMYVIYKKEVNWLIFIESSLCVNSVTNFTNFSLINFHHNSDM